MQLAIDQGTVLLDDIYTATATVLPNQCSYRMKFTHDLQCRQDYSRAFEKCFVSFSCFFIRVETL